MSTKMQTFMFASMLFAASASNASAPPNTPPKASPLDMTAANMEAELTKLMLGKSVFGATPMGGSVKQIENLLTKTMMPAVLAAHKSDQENLIRLSSRGATTGPPQGNKQGSINAL